MIRKKIIVISLAVLILGILAPVAVSAQKASDAPTGGKGSYAPINFNLKSPLSSSAGTSLETFIKAILNDIVLPIGAVVVVIFIIYSGFLFVTAQGSEDKLETAKKTLLWTLIGAAVLLGSWAIAQIINSTINQLRQGVSMITMYLG